MTLQEGRAVDGAGRSRGPIDLTTDIDGALRTIAWGGRYKDAIARDSLFRASNQGAQAVSVALATTYTGLCLSNPLNSGYRLSVRAVSVALTVAPAAIASLHLIGGFSATADVAHTAALVPGSCRLGSSVATVGKADSQATIPTPLYLLPLVSGFTAAALPSHSPGIIELDGLFTLDPGGFIAIGALTAVTGLFGIVWEENQI